MKYAFIIGLLGIGLAAGFGSYAFFNAQNTEAPVPTIVLENSPQPVVDQFIEASPDTDALKAGGSSHLDPDGGYVFLYPSDYELQLPGNGDTHTRLSKRGATQRGQTEIYDGVVIVFEPVELGEQSLSEWIDARIQASTADGTSEIIQPKSATTLGTYPGFMYEMRGLGSSTNLYVQKTSDSSYALGITYMVADPEGMNYDKEVEQILATLELLK